MKDYSALWIPCGVEAKCMKNNQSVHWSGIVLHNLGKKYVITSASPLAHCLVGCTDLQDVSQLPTYLMSNERCTLTFSVCLPFARESKLHKTYDKFLAKPLLIWNCHKLEIELKTLYSSPLIGKDKKSMEINLLCGNKSIGANDLLSWFILLEFEPTIPISLNENHNQFKCIISSNISVGMTVLTSSFPFGNSGHPVFQGCISRGIICNVFNESIILVDASCLPGSEGSAVYASDFKLIGIVVSLLGLETEQLSGLSIACSFELIMMSLKEQFMLSNIRCTGNLKHVVQSILSPSCSKLSSINSRKDISEIEVVRLTHNKGWGSGVVVAIHLQSNMSRIFIATCRHVIEPAVGKSLVVKFSKRLKIPIVHGEVVYKTAINSWLDFALVQVMCSNDLAAILHSTMAKFMQASTSNPMINFINYAMAYKKGIPVLTKGYCLFDYMNYKPSVTAGVVSNVLYSSNVHNDKCDAMLIFSNCVVLDLTSGGGLFSKHENSFYGLVVNNIKQFVDDKKHILYPRINFILPSCLFMPNVVSYVHGDKNAFDLLDKLSSLPLNDTWIISNEDSSVIARNAFKISKL